MTWLLGGTAVDPATDEGTALLAAAHVRKDRLHCACTHPHPEMYIAKTQGKFLVKRMPETGAEHAPDCPSWMPPEELSGLAQGFCCKDFDVDCFSGEIFAYACEF